MATETLAKSHAELLEPGIIPKTSDDMQIDSPRPQQDLLPAAYSVANTFRLTREWDRWPSAGIFAHEVSNLQQAQYGVVADVIFETLKVCMWPAVRIVLLARLLSSSNRSSSFEPGDQSARIMVEGSLPA